MISLPGGLLFFRGLKSYLAQEKKGIVSTNLSK